MAAPSSTDRGGRPDDLNAARAAAETAAGATPPDDPDAAFQRTVFGLALLGTGRHDLAVAELEWAAEQTPAGDPEQAARWSNLAIALGKRFTQAGQTADLDRAIAAAERATAAARAVSASGTWFPFGAVHGAGFAYLAIRACARRDRRGVRRPRLRPQR